MKELIEYIVKLLAEKPDQVVVNEIVGEKTNIIELKVAPSDLGKVIGKQGRTAKALRTILNAAAARKNIRAMLEIIED